MDKGISGQTTHTEGQRKSNPSGVIRASNVSEIRHRRLLATLDGLTDAEAKILQDAIKANQIAGSFHELMTGTNGHG